MQHLANLAAWIHFTGFPRRCDAAALVLTAPSSPVTLRSVSARRVVLLPLEGDISPPFLEGTAGGGRVGGFDGATGGGCVSHWGHGSLVVIT